MDELSFFIDAGIADDEVERRMIAAVDRAFDTPERRMIPAGTRLLAHGDAVERIWIVLEGRVRLSRNVDGRELVFHDRTAGRVVGLLAMARNQPAYFDSTAATDLTVVTLTFEDLDRALRADPVLAVHFVTVLLRSLARRNLRSVELRIEVDRLNRDLAADRDRLAAALDDLEDAQTRIIQQGQMATLGQLAAGIGHELNNPIAAIERAADFLSQDLSELSAGTGDDRMMSRFLTAALERPPVSTRVEREQRRALARELGDDDLARRLVAIGITDEAAYRATLGGLDAEARESRLAEVERYHGLGTSLRNIRSAAGRISDLVGSLRSYARAGRELTPDIDVCEGLEETLLLLRHELHGIEIVRDYGEVPPITGYSGRLNQVWTNLIHNAARAMGGGGTLTVRTAPAGPGIRVEIADTGPGIAPEHLPEIFDMHFTTYDGRVGFGLGLGLRLSKDIVTRHGGTIAVESRPGRTVFTVTLPPEPPPDSEEP
jgi:signal transduction histidine kinase